MRILQRPTHSQRLERWLGAEHVASVSRAMETWYGPAIAVGNVPGAVFVAPGGDFVGPIAAGRFGSVADYVADRAWKREQVLRRRLDRWFRANRTDRFHAGFASLSELISALSTGQRRDVWFAKATGVAGVVGATHSLWGFGAHPAAGGAGAAAPGGTAWSISSTGATVYSNAASGTLHLVRGDVCATVGGNTLMLYDRLFSVAKTMSSTATEAVTGVPTRYQNTTAGAADSAEGNFLFMEPSATLGATAHNWTVCQYTDQSGNTGATLPTVTGVSGCIAGRQDMPTGTWFAPLASGDSGILALTQMQCSASVTGTLNFVIGHPIAIMPCPVANAFFVQDGVNTALSLVRIFDDACLSWLELIKPATTSTAYTGQLTMAYN